MAIGLSPSHLFQVSGGLEEVAIDSPEAEQALMDLCPEPLCGDIDQDTDWDPVELGEDGFVAISDCPLAQGWEQDTCATYSIYVLISESQRQA